MLPGPPSRNNGGAADLSPTGLLAYAAGSSVVVVESRSMQLVSVLPMPSPSSPSLSPFVTAVRWTPQILRRHLLTHEASNSHLLLAAGDRHGRIALWDFRSKSVILWFEFDPDKSKLGIQDLCWIQSKSDSWVLASINGSSLLSLWNTSTGRCIWKYDASPEFFSCIRSDPFDTRHFCAIGLKGFLASVKVLGETEDDIVIKEIQISTDSSELQKLERDVAGAGNGGSSSPASAVFPLHIVRFAFSPHWRNIVFASFPKELIVFDLQYESSLFAAGLPRGCSKFCDVLPDLYNELLYCVHLDGKLSTWRRKEGEQVHMMCTMEELIPSIGTTVPSPSILTVTISRLDSTLQNIGRIYSDIPSSSPNEDFDNPFDFSDDSLLVSKTHLISVSDDGKIWNWVVTAENVGEVEKDANLATVADISKMKGQQTDFVGNRSSHLTKSTFSLTDTSFKISLVGQLHLLSSTVTMLAVPSPSLMATLACGGNNQAVPVPLVALGTQSGTIDVIDVSATAVAASFSVHNGTVRGLRWLGNSRLVSFSYTQVNEKSGGYNNRLVVTCLRSGLNRTFRVLQKSERAPIRALRASSSGRYLLILFRDAPVEVWAMTKNPVMVRS